MGDFKEMEDEGDEVDEGDKEDKWQMTNPPETFGKSN